MPRAAYSALIGPTAIWMIMLSPRVENLRSRAPVIWASVAAGSLAIKPKRSVPAGILEMSKPRPWAMAAALDGSAIACWIKDTATIALASMGFSLPMVAWSMGLRTYTGSFARAGYSPTYWA